MVLSPILYAGIRSGGIDSGSALNHVSPAPARLSAYATQPLNPPCTMFHILVKPHGEAIEQLTGTVESGTLDCTNGKTQDSCQ
jgi:hypothetical protein